MEKFIVKGGKKLKGEVTISGAKNVALKALVAACLTNEEVKIQNVPLISDFFIMIDIIKDLGGDVKIKDHTAFVKVKSFKKHKIELDKAAHIRTSSMFIAPLLIRNKMAFIPNPGGCRLGARPIDRIIEGLNSMGARIVYESKDGYFHAKTEGLVGTSYTFDKSTHTGTETLILASVMAQGKTILKNAALEPEIDELILLLQKMGAKIIRKKNRVIEIEGVKSLHGTQFSIGPDRNEIVTFAIAAIVTKGDVFVKNVKKSDLIEFLDALERVGGGIEEKENGIRFYYKGRLKQSNITTVPYPGFMTDWQAPWAVLMTQANGVSTIHETVFENRFSYVEEIRKMGAKIKPFNPPIKNPENTYNFNPSDDNRQYFRAIQIFGPTKLHDAVVTMTDLRAGASLVIAALAAYGESVIHGVYLVDRGYEQFDKRLNKLGAEIKRTKDD